MVQVPVKRVYGKLILYYVHNVQGTGAPSSILVWTAVSATSGDLTLTCTHSDNAAVFGAIGVQIMRLSFILNVTTITSTYYLNYSRVAGSGSGLATNTANSRIAFTRIGLKKSKLIYIPWTK